MLTLAETQPVQQQPLGRRESLVPQPSDESIAQRTLQHHSRFSATSINIGEHFDACGNDHTDSPPRADPNAAERMNYSANVWNNFNSGWQVPLSRPSASNAPSVRQRLSGYASSFEIKSAVLVPMCETAMND